MATEISIATPILNGWTMFSRSVLSSPQLSSRSWGSRRCGRPRSTRARSPSLSIRIPRSPPLRDPWAFVEQMLGWEARHVAGAPGGPAIPDELLVALPGTRHHAEADMGGRRARRRQNSAGSSSSASRPRGSIRMRAARSMAGRRRRISGSSGCCATRASFAGLTGDGQGDLRLIYAPRGETSGHLTFPIRPLGTGRRPADAGRAEAAARSLFAVH